MKTPLFVTGTGRSVGKTVVTLGLMLELARSHRLGFIKPLGLARLRAGRDGIDLDAMLIEKTCGLHENIKDMCPVTLSHAEWPEVTEQDSERMMVRIREAFERVRHDRDLVVVEGTGHAALGTALGLSNARVAAEFGCRVLLVASYGVRSSNPFDHAALNRHFFAAHGVEVIGVVINHIPPEQLDSFTAYARAQLDRLGLPLVGALPADPALKTFRFVQVSEFLEGEFLSGARSAETIIDRVRVGAMTPHRAIAFFNPRSLIITPGDREDIIVTACACASRKQGGPAGLVLSGAQRPHAHILELLEESRLPTFLAREDSYTVASKIHDMPLRIVPTDAEKISKVQQLVLDLVDVEAVVGRL
ncbi:MAG: phosphotransacetylase family protein [Planctomycetota bacterium]